MIEVTRLQHEDLKIASERILTALSEVIAVNTIYVSVNDSRCHFVLKAFNRKDVLVREGSRLTEDTNDTATVLEVPIMLKDGVTVGTLCAMDVHPYSFQRPDRVLLRTMASLLGYVIELESSAYRDPLTNGYNRNYLELFTAQLVNSNSPIAFLFIDLDNFKAINDTYDHSTGDTILQAVANRIRKHIRKATDDLCRIGGDEFLVIVPDYDTMDTLHRIVEAIMAELTQPIATQYGKLSVSASMGVSRYPEDGTDIKLLVNRADHAMYKVKSQGKNSVSFYSQPLALFPDT